MTLNLPTAQAEERGHEILSSIRQAFAEKGFDGASMQDLARAAGMSVGNFYRYFPSKAAIVEAMCNLDLAEIERDFARVRVSGDPMVGLRTMIIETLGEECQEDGKLWAEITAAALRKPEIAAAALKMEATILRHLTMIFAQVTGRTPEAATERYAGHSEMLVMLVKAVVMRASQRGPASPALAGMVLRSIDLILNDLSDDIAKG